MVKGRVADLLGGVIAAEEKAAVFYEGLLRKFQHSPRAAALWQNMLDDEKEHRRLMEQARVGLTADELQAPANPEMLHKLMVAMHFSPDRALRQVHDLNDAYEFALDLEQGEINVVFEFILTEYAHLEEGVRDRLVELYLRDHIKRFQELQGESWRRSVKALDEERR